MPIGRTRVLHKQNENPQSTSLWVFAFIYVVCGSFNILLYTCILHCVWVTGRGGPENERSVEGVCRDRERGRQWDSRRQFSVTHEQPQTQMHKLKFRCELVIYLISEYNINQQRLYFFAVISSLNKCFEQRSIAVYFFKFLQ